jgi:hypothetical protein
MAGTDTWPLATDLDAQTFDQVSIVLHDLGRAAMKSGQPLITDRTFRNVRFEGPSVFLAASGNSFDATDFGYSGGDVRNLILRPASPSKVIGAVAFRDCTFVGCRFFAIGFTGPESFLKQLLALGTPQ